MRLVGAEIRVCKWITATIAPAAAAVKIPVSRFAHFGRNFPRVKFPPSRLWESEKDGGTRMLRKKRKKTKPMPWFFKVFFNRPQSNFYPTWKKMDAAYDYLKYWRAELELWVSSLDKPKLAKKFIEPILSPNFLLIKTRKYELELFWKLGSWSFDPWAYLLQA